MHAVKPPCSATWRHQRRERFLSEVRRVESLEFRWSLGRVFRERTSRGVLPAALTFSRGAPASMSSLTIGAWPWRQPWWSGVLPCSSAESMLTDDGSEALSHAVNSPVDPAAALVCNGRRRIVNSMSPWGTYVWPQRSSDKRRGSAKAAKNRRRRDAGKSVAPCPERCSAVSARDGACWPSGSCDGARAH